VAERMRKVRKVDDKRLLRPPCRSRSALERFALQQFSSNRNVKPLPPLASSA
jgi:hypothetical protein